MASIALVVVVAIVSLLALLRYPADLKRTDAINRPRGPQSIAHPRGVPQPTITRFLTGADMRISNAAKVATHLGLSLSKKG